MSAPRKYDREYCDRLEQEPGESKLGVRGHVGALLDLKPATLRNWVEEAERAAGERGPRPQASSDSEEIETLKRRVAQLERANHILRTSAAFLAQAELDRRLR
jgi:transposase-like protein